MDKIFFSRGKPQCCSQSPSVHNEPVRIQRSGSDLYISTTVHVTSGHCLHNSPGGEGKFLQNTRCPSICSNSYSCCSPCSQYSQCQSRANDNWREKAYCHNCPKRFGLNEIGKLEGSPNYYPSFRNSFGAINNNRRNGNCRSIAQEYFSSMFPESSPLDNRSNNTDEDYQPIFKDTCRRLPNSPNSNIPKYEDESDNFSSRPVSSVDEDMRNMKFQQQQFNDNSYGANEQQQQHIENVEDDGFLIPILGYLRSALGAFLFDILSPGSVDRQLLNNSNTNGFFEFITGRTIIDFLTEANCICTEGQKCETKNMNPVIQSETNDACPFTPETKSPGLPFERKDSAKVSVEKIAKVEKQKIVEEQLDCSLLEDNDPRYGSCLPRPPRKSYVKDHRKESLPFEKNKRKSSKQEEKHDGKRKRSSSIPVRISRKNTLAKNDKESLQAQRRRSGKLSMTFREQMKSETESEESSSSEWQRESSSTESENRNKSNGRKSLSSEDATTTTQSNDEEVKHLPFEKNKRKSSTPKLVDNAAQTVEMSDENTQVNLVPCRARKTSEGTATDRQTVSKLHDYGQGRRVSGKADLQFANAVEKAFEQLGKYETKEEKVHIPPCARRRSTKSKIPVRCPKLSSPSPCALAAAAEKAKEKENNANVWESLSIAPTCSHCTTFGTDNKDKQKVPPCFQKKKEEDMKDVQKTDPSCGCPFANVYTAQIETNSFSELPCSKALAASMNIRRVKESRKIDYWPTYQPPAHRMSNLKLRKIQTQANCKFDQLPSAYMHQDSEDYASVIGLLQPYTKNGKSPSTSPTMKKELSCDAIQNKDEVDSEYVLLNGYRQPKLSEDYHKILSSCPCLNK